MPTCNDNDFAHFFRHDDQMKQTTNMVNANTGCIAAIPNTNAINNIVNKQDFMPGILHTIFPPGNPHLQELKRSYASPLNEGITTAKIENAGA